MEKKRTCESCENEINEANRLAFINKKRKYATRYFCCICGYYSSISSRKTSLHQGKCADLKSKGLCSYCKKSLIEVGKNSTYNLCYNCGKRLLNK